jgi:hypothetical protein
MIFFSPSQLPDLLWCALSLLFNVNWEALSLATK